MADREIGTLDTASSLSEDDLFLVRQGGSAKKITVAKMRNALGGGGGGASGAYRFEVNDDGELVLVYEGMTPPAYSINDDGDLILTLDDGQTINVGHVQGRNGKAGTTPAIGSNGNWFIGSMDTGVLARGTDGTNGTDGTDGRDGTVISEISVVVDDSAGNPSCTVSEGGTAEERTYTLTFSGLKGKDGEVTFSALTDEEKASLKGEGISGITVTVDDTSSDDPACVVTRSGDGTDKAYLLAFSGLKGKRGADNLPDIAALSGDSVSLTLSHNVEYRCADAVASLTIEGFTSATDGKASMWAIQFTAGDGIAVSVPESVTWAVAAPIWTAGATYWLSFVPLITGKILGVWASDE